MPPSAHPDSITLPNASGKAPHRIREVPLAFVATLWLGVLLGVSFLATPVKFQAPSLDLPTALDVGRVTFALFAKVEWALCALLLLAALLSRGSRFFGWAGIAGLALILLAQALWLLPVLDARVGRIIEGVAVPPTSHHILYIAADSMKAILLLALSVAALRRLAASREAAPCA